ncbi:MAG: hypothetical protein UR28_C0033G0003 [Candidatus Peregrinibacteria bacterium GW2011_GWF2_33_10]|nr:MAG: hypothetical protein UR28_C0033G0003 [Candidatus Peregrinibacteria bacterium GW2011_GWF2_33_10]OGJ44351.1 MAG: hypothetical protein A2272_05765 [Candidatus Peregrinibacteria bacterium RIFOXYA12_FULL_33_12]OGJ44479.1 MAG: hypothetical protein A2263_00355 [Candidatus Peregrinibacteria bacterium RIFOXYA2_FULL_33_21]OGJ50229.1 MAG: hypothetical protein A2307_06610 [Candidatus Peregrinibacteria bacterium RIFOXYB2_FULL_33_20]
MNKKLYLLLVLTLTGLMIVIASSCTKSADQTKEVSGRPTMSDEKKQEIESNVQAVDAAYDLNQITAYYNVKNRDTALQIAFFAAGETDALTDIVYGIWVNNGQGGIIEGKVTKDGQLTGTWKTADGSYGKTVLVFNKSEAGMIFKGTWGQGVSMTNLGLLDGQEDDKSILTKTKIAELKTQYQTINSEAESNEPKADDNN